MERSSKGDNSERMFFQKYPIDPKRRITIGIDHILWFKNAFNDLA